MTFPGQHLCDEQLELWWAPDFLSAFEADALFSHLSQSLAWQQGQVRMFGKWIDEPRLTVWYGDPGASYTYSGKQQQPLPWTPALLALKEKIETSSSTSFNSVLGNYYRSGQDSMGWHSDNEKELGIRPLIASLNLGATRTFQLRMIKDKSRKLSLDLSHGSLLIMSGETQHHWQHQIPKTKKAVGERLNFTFRLILTD
ncbi:MAG: alpha-ketoglutarate-dependent dioxygenase AlkB [Bacteroidia bacterium]|nr:alpha-ketoglutarate-dependent dioxygenase AlkB [Bacteroidia bacterium]